MFGSDSADSSPRRRARAASAACASPSLHLRATGTVPVAATRPRSPPTTASRSNAPRAVHRLPWRQICRLPDTGSATPCRRPVVDTAVDSRTRSLHETKLVLAD